METLKLENGQTITNTFQYNVFQTRKEKDIQIIITSCINHNTMFFKREKKLYNLELMKWNGMKMMY